MRFGDDFWIAMKKAGPNYSGPALSFYRTRS
jgi:hypothetical protein